jgi:hypothetical protein
MFTKLLDLLFSNVFVSSSVLLCYKSLASKCGLKGRKNQKEDLVPVSALERMDAMIEPSVMRSSAYALKPKSRD